MTQEIKIRFESLFGQSDIDETRASPLTQFIMPTYDYKCETCGHQFEFFQSMKDDRLTDCPLEDCDGKVKRLLGTGAGIIFKGSGFYETDYKRGDSYKKEAKADSGDSGGGSDSSDSKSDSKKSSDSKSESSSQAKEATPAKSSSG